MSEENVWSEKDKCWRIVSESDRCGFLLITWILHVAHSLSHLGDPRKNRLQYSPGYFFKICRRSMWWLWLPHLTNWFMFLILYMIFLNCLFSLIHKAKQIFLLFSERSRGEIKLERLASATRWDKFYSVSLLFLWRSGLKFSINAFWKHNSIMPQVPRLCKKLCML